MEKLWYLLFVLKRSYLCDYIICMTVPLTKFEYEVIQRLLVIRRVYSALSPVVYEKPVFILRWRQRVYSTTEAATSGVL